MIGSSRIRIFGVLFFIGNVLLCSSNDVQDHPADEELALKPFFLRSNITCPAAEPAEHVGEEPITSANRKPIFLDSFLKYLKIRGLAENRGSYFEIDVNDLPSNDLNITFEKSDAKEYFNTTVDILAKALTFVLQEAERVNYDPKLSCSVSLKKKAEQELGILVLKTSAG